MSLESRDTLSVASTLLMPRTVAIAGGKGGIGKTVLSVATCLELAKSGYSVTLIDADLGGANIAAIFGLDDLKATLKDYLVGNIADLDELVQPSGIKHLNIIPGTVGDYGLANINYAIKQKFIRNFPKIQSDWIILDLGAGTFFDQLDFYNAAQTGVIITTPDPMAIQDSFNFIKLSLFRKIYNTFHPVKELRKIVEQFLYSHRNDELDIFNQVKNNIFHENEQYKLEWSQLVNSFKPILVLNRVMNEEELREGIALRIALKEMFGISFQGFTFVHYDEQIQNLCTHCKPEQFSDINSPASNDINEFVHQYLLGKANGDKDEKSNKNIEQNVEKKEKDNLICSVNCELWGKCSMQMGGYPCRIPALGFINQKK